MSKDIELYVTAHITGTIEFHLSDRWSKDESIGNIQRQAKRDAIAKVNRLLKGEGSIQGEPQVHITVTEKVER